MLAFAGSRLPALANQSDDAAPLPVLLAYPDEVFSTLAGTSWILTAEGRVADGRLVSFRVVRAGEVPVSRAQHFSCWESKWKPVDQTYQTKTTPLAILRMEYATVFRSNVCRWRRSKRGRMADGPLRLVST